LLQFCPSCFETIGNDPHFWMSLVVFDTWQTDCHVWIPF